MPGCPICGKACGCNAPPSPIGAIAKPCPLAKGAIWVHVLDDAGTNVPLAGALRDGGNDLPTDTNGLSVYDPLDAKPYTVALKPLSEDLAKEYLPPATVSYPVSVLDGQITYVGFQLIRKMNDVTPEMTATPDEIQPLFPDMPDVVDEMHFFHPEKKKSDEKPKVVTVKLGYKETLTTYAYDKGGVFTVTGVKVTFWKEEDCKTPIAGDGSLTVVNSDLKGGYTFYMRAEAGGTANLSFSLEGTTKARVITDTSALTKAVTVKAVNRVTPYLKVEHLVVLRDQELFKEQRKNDSKAGTAAADADQHIHPDPTRIELSAAKAADAPEYKGKGKLILTPANVKVYKEETCETEIDISQGIDFGKLTEAQPLKYWLRGVTAGAFTAELKLDPSNDPLIKVDDPMQGKMGCVELKLKLFHYKRDEINQAVEPDVDDVTTYWDQLKGLTFEQKEMLPAERVGVGRMIHLKNDKNYTRAKLIVEHTPDQWPDAAKDYKIIVDAADWDKKNKTRSGGLELYDAEEDGNKVDLPRKLTLEAAKDKKEVWVEGTTICNGWRGIRLSAGFERPDGGPDWKPKLDADWGAFTVINIKEVKCDVDNVGGQEKFVDGDKVFVNLDDKGRVLKTVTGKRKADITAEIEPKLKEVDIFFSIVEHADNYKITKVPDIFKELHISKVKHALRPVDRTDRKKLLTMFKETDANGLAKIETLETPQLGLMKFKVGAYIDQDPGQARYIEDHADLKKKKPAMSANWKEVWRRLFFKVAAMKRFSGTSTVSRFDEAGIKGEMESRGILLEQVGATVEPAYVTVVPQFLNWSRSAAVFNGVAAARTLYFCVINNTGDFGDKTLPANLGAPLSLTPTWNFYFPFRDTSVKANWLNYSRFTTNGVQHDVAATTSLSQTADYQFAFTVDLNAIWTQVYNAQYQIHVNQPMAPPLADAQARADADLAISSGAITVELKYASQSSGIAHMEAVGTCLDTREITPPADTQDPTIASKQTFLHEIGHYLGLAGKFQPDEANTQNPNFYSELGGETSQAGFGGVGVGPHCDGLTNDCVMWYQFGYTKLSYCPMCDLLLRSRALHNPKIDARATL